MSPPEAVARRQVHLFPGSLFCAAAPTAISTILGSCIAICLWDPLRRQGGMNHYVLPKGGAARGDARYGDVAIDQLIEGMDALGSPPRGLVAKVFGGAAVLAADSRLSTVGGKNLELALRRLDACHIRVVGQRTGGAHGLMVRFATDLGEAVVRTVPGLIA